MTRMRGEEKNHLDFVSWASPAVLMSYWIAEEARSAICAQKPVVLTFPSTIIVFGYWFVHMQ